MQLARIALKLSLQKACGSAVGLLFRGTVGLIPGFAEGDQGTSVWWTPGLYRQTSAPLSNVAQEEQVLWHPGAEGSAHGSWLWCWRPWLQDLQRPHSGLGGAGHRASGLALSASSGSRSREAHTARKGAFLPGLRRAEVCTG